MTDILAMMGSWSGIAVYGLMGAIFGGGFALLGALLESLTGLAAFRWAVVLGFATSSVFTREVAIPAIKVASVNQNLPQRIDDVTVLSSFELNGKNYIYHFTVDESVPADFDPNEIKQGILPNLCANFKPDFENGSLKTAEYQYRRGLLGAPRSFFVRQSDC